MSERVAMVTGAGRGIGRAAAIELATKGFQLALVSRTRAELEATAALCKGNARTFICDVSDSQGVDKLIEDVLGSFGRVDALVHCAGVALMRSIESITLEEWRSIDRYESFKHLFPLPASLAGLAATGRRGGCECFILCGKDPFAGLGAYGAAKAGVNLLGLALSREGVEIGVRVHTVAPAATETAMLRSLISTDQVPTDKTLTPEAVARVIIQCVCGDLACTSGEVIYVHR